MKSVIAALVLFSTVSQASELVGRSQCDQLSVDPMFQSHNDYVFSSQPGDDRVKVEITLTNQEQPFTELAYSSFRTSVISSLKRVGTQVVHIPTGTVCAELKKPLIGKRYFMDNGNCKFSSVDRKFDVLDADGFETKKVCVRDYFLTVK